MLKPVLDLWCGSKSATQAWSEQGHEIISVDNDPETNPTICKDILSVTVDELRELAPDGYAFGWASPDCRVYSLMNLHSGHWDMRGSWAYPKTDQAIEANMRLVWTLHLLKSLDLPYFAVENPRAMMRKQQFMNDFQRETVSYCRYGDNRMKPTDLFGRLPPSFVPLMCANNSPSCTHRRAPRGSRTGTQGMTRDEAQRVPIALSEALMMACFHSDGAQWATLEDFQ
jgi:hypothetical protein